MGQTPEEVPGEFVQNLTEEVILVGQSNKYREICRLIVVIYYDCNPLIPLVI